MQMRLELVTIPASDVDRAKEFYVGRVGFTVEQDVQVDGAHRFVELMPPGSPCSIALQTATWTPRRERWGASSSTSIMSTRCTPSCGAGVSLLPEFRTTRGGAFASSRTPMATD